MINFQEWNATLDELARHWESLRDERFPPGLAGAVIDGVDLVMIDTDIAMLIQSCIDKGKLSPGGANRMELLLGELKGVAPLMPPAGVEYFSELAGVGELAL